MHIAALTSHHWDMQIICQFFPRQRGFLQFCKEKWKLESSPENNVTYRNSYNLLFHLKFFNFPQKVSNFTVHQTYVPLLWKKTAFIFLYIAPHTTSTQILTVLLEIRIIITLINFYVSKEKRNTLHTITRKKFNWLLQYLISILNNIWSNWINNNLYKSSKMEDKMMTKT